MVKVPNNEGMFPTNAEIDIKVKAVGKIPARRKHINNQHRRTRL